MNLKPFFRYCLVSLCLASSLGAYAVEVGQPAPVFNLPTLQNNQATDFKKFAGKVVYLDFWASWCMPCRTSFPLLNELQHTLKSDDFAVVAVNLDEDPPKAAQFLQEFKVDFTVLRDASGEWADKYVVESMPTSFIIDRQGVVQHIHHGFTSSDIKDLEAKVKALIAKK
jgi:thiol-disulfide isomerase/thioredoxin